MNKIILLTASLALVTACENERLTREIARIQITPMPEGVQTGLDAPPGLDLGQVPLHGLGAAHFRIDNIGTATLRITGSEVRDASGGVFGVELSDDEGDCGSSEELCEIGAFNTDDTAGELIVAFEPQADGMSGEATIALFTNAGDNAEETVVVQVRGVGLFVGEPNLEICYGGECFPQDGHCTDRGDGKSVCRLPALDWGNVPLSSSLTQEIRLRNAPLADTCEPPPGSPECTPVCRLVFDRDPTNRNVGFGFDPDSTGFALQGNISLPFSLDVANPQCEFVDEERLLVNFTSGAEEGVHESVLIVENNDPDAQFIEIPVKATAREAPIAVAELLPCTVETLPNCTASADGIRPLDRVFLTGENSYDPSTPPRPLVSWEWTIAEYPPGANPADFLGCQTSDDCLGGACECTDTDCDERQCAHDPTQDRFSMWLPLAGRYLVRLRVTNDLGIASGVTPTSEVEFFAIPDSRMHVQLVWDHPTNDQDLHVTSVNVGDLVCGAPGDCFWGNCKLSCLEPDADCRDEPRWFVSDPVYEGPNPRLDIDDTHGLGPENVNIDSPQPDRFRIYVHYYTLVDRSEDPTQATVRIYIDGQLTAEYRRVLDPDDLWRVAEIEWFPDNSSVVRPATSDGGGQGATRTMTNCSHAFDFGGPF